MGRNFLRLELESDALDVINALLHGEESFAADGHILDGIKDLMRHFDYSRGLIYAPRECNKVVNKLASFATKQQMTCTWFTRFFILVNYIYSGRLECLVLFWMFSSYVMLCFYPINLSF